MMLESSLGKILASKPVEPSISKEDAVAPATKSEAEVKQLESEELSRIVSRIAWDGAKDEKKPSLEDETLKSDKIIDCHQQNPEQDGRNESTDNTKSECGMSISGYANLTSQDGGSKKVVEMDCYSPGSNESKSAGVSPDRSASTSSEQSLNSSDPLIILDSDNHTTTESEANNAESNLHPNSSYRVVRIQERGHLGDQSQDVELKSVISTAPSYILECEAAAAAAAEAAAENQMIVEALYDCVYSVDLESRRSEQKHNLAIENPTSLGAKGDGYTETSRGEEIEQLSSAKEKVKPDKKPLMEAANVPSNNDITQATILSSDECSFNEKGAHTIQACKDDLNLRLEGNKKTEINMASRRRNTSDNITTSRRVRRGGAKDQRTSKISASDKFGDAFERRVSDRSGGLIQRSENLVRQSKVFAKWSDNHFYPGTILKPVKDRKFEIGFFDGARKDVAETDLIPLANIIQKQVRVSIAKDYCVNALVHEKIISSSGQPMFDVEYQQNGLVKKVIPLRDIFLTAEQGIPLISQPLRPDKNPDESMFAGVDLDNIVHVKRSRRLQEMEDLEMAEDTATQISDNLNESRRKRGQYNMRSTTNRARVSTNKPEGNIERGLKRLQTDVNNQDTPVSSCSPDNIKPHLHSSNSNPPSESSSSTGSINSASNVEMGQEFYFESSSPHRTKTSLLL